MTIGTLIFRGVLCFAMITLMAFSLWYVAEIEIAEDNQRMVDMIIGAIITQTTLAMGWWFSSSKGSDDKTGIIARQNPRTNPDDV